jgi:hypothetical protein
MRADAIHVGMTLRLKPAIADAHDVPRGSAVLVTAVTFRGGYRTPWVWSGTLAYRPSDFQGEAS